ncbi:MAG TPA: hypothetical protein VFT90_09880 [Chryseosolibacter sp.]|nr:hypothetical protein [Chryseosolibacter sp.]
MRTTIGVGGVLLLMIVIAGYMIVNKPHRSVDVDEFIPIGARRLYMAFRSNEALANGVYLDKVVQVDGSVSAVLANQDGEQVVLLEGGDDLYGISCSMVEETADIKPGMSVKIKGICTGYLSDVIVVRGRLVK